MYKQKAKKYKKASHHAPHLDVADLGAAVCRPDLCDDRQRLEITGQTQITTGSCYLHKSTVGSGMSCFCIYINHRFRRRALLLLKLQSCTSHTRKAQQSHFLLRVQVCSTCVWQEGSETFQSNEKNSNSTALQTTQAVYYLISPIRFIISSHFSSLTHRGMIKGVNTLKNILN